MLLFIVTILVFASCGAVVGNPESGIYVISNDIDENGQNVTLAMDARPAQKGQRLGDVVTNSYQKLASTHWNITTVHWLYCLTPQENTKNQVTDRCGPKGNRGYRFRSAGNGTHIIEYIVGRRAPSCLQNNGRNKPISFVNCPRSEVDAKPLPRFLWKLTPVSTNSTTTTTGRSTTAGQ